MSGVSNQRHQKPLQFSLPSMREADRAANALCQKALNEAKRQLHPLLHNVELDRLDQRHEFLQAFRHALEREIAWRLAVWYPDIQAVFRYEETPMKNTEDWDASIHLLVKISRLSKNVDALGKMLDRSLVKYFKTLQWQRFQECQSILNVQQVTANELRHGIGYGALFYAVYTAPVKVWPVDDQIE
jgi:hypothetical protein